MKWGIPVDRKGRLPRMVCGRRASNVHGGGRAVGLGALSLASPGLECIRVEGAGGGRHAARICHIQIPNQTRAWTEEEATYLNLNFQKYAESESRTGNGEKLRNT